MFKRLTCVTVFAVGLVQFSFPAMSESVSHSEAAQITSMLDRFVRNAHINAQAWDEETVPLLHIDSIRRGSSSVRIVRGCEFQPSLLLPGVRIEAVIVRARSGWRVASFSTMGSCNGSAEAAPSALSLDRP